MMNKRILLATGAAVLTLAALGGMNKANAVTENGTAEAIIVAPISITAVDSLDFGMLSVGVAGGTAVITSGGAFSVTGDVVAEGGTPTRGTFDLYGDTNYSVSIEVTNSPVTITSGGDTMTVDNFILAYNGFGPSAADTLLPNVDLVGVTGTNLNVGGTLNVAASQPPGAYTGSFTVEVLYE